MAEVTSTGGSKGPKKVQRAKIDSAQAAVDIGQKVLSTAVSLFGDKLVAKYKGPVFDQLKGLAEAHLGKDGIAKDLADAGIKVLSDAADKLKAPPALSRDDAIFGATEFKSLEDGLFQISGGKAARETHGIHQLLDIAGLDNKKGFSATVKDLITGASKLDLRVKTDWLKLGSSILMTALATPGGWQAKLAGAAVALGDGVIGAVDVSVKPKNGEETAANGDASKEAEAKKTVGATPGYTLAPVPTNGEEKRFNPMAALLGQMMTTTREVEKKGKDGSTETASVLQFRRLRPSAADANKSEAVREKANAVRRELVSAEAITNEVVRLLGGRPGKASDKASQLLMQALHSVDGKDNGPTGGDQLSLMLAVYRTAATHAKEQGLPETKQKRLESVINHLQILQRMFVKEGAERVNFNIFSPHLTNLLNRMVMASVVDLVQQVTGLRPNEQLGLDQAVIGNLQRGIRTGEMFKAGQSDAKATRLKDLLESRAASAGRLPDSLLPPVSLSKDGPAIALKADQTAALASGLAQTLGLPEGSAPKIDAALQEAFKSTTDGKSAPIQVGLNRYLLQFSKRLAPSLMAANELWSTSASALKMAQDGVEELKPIFAQLDRAEADLDKEVKRLERAVASESAPAAKGAAGKSPASQARTLAAAKAKLEGAQADLKTLREYRTTLQARAGELNETIPQAGQGVQSGALRFLQEVAQAASDPEAYKVKAQASETKAEEVTQLFEAAKGEGEAATKAAKEILDSPENLAKFRELAGKQADQAVALLREFVGGGEPPGKDPPKNGDSGNAGDGGNRGGGNKVGSEKDLTIAQQRYFACRAVLADSSLSIQDKMLYFLFIFAMYTDRERESSMEEFTKQDQAQAQWKATEKSLDQSIADRGKVVAGLEEEFKVVSQRLEIEKKLPTGVSSETQTKYDAAEQSLSRANATLESATKDRDTQAKDMGANAKNQDIMFMNLERITQRYTQLLQLINSLLEKSDRLIEKLSR